MIQFELAKPEDAKALALISWQAFEHDINYGAPSVGGPPGYKSDRWQRKMMSGGHYYKISLDDRIIGGFIIFDKGGGHYQLGRIFLEPECQNKGIGTQTVQFIEKMYPAAKKWTLDTPRWAVRNHHFYQKMGYVEVKTTKDNLVWYQKLMNGKTNPALKFSLEDLHRFIVKAKAATYVGNGQKCLSYRPGSHDLQFHDGNFSYIDSYFGGTDFLGQEVVYYSGQPVWVMNYYGQILEPSLITAAEAGQIIKESLSAMYGEGRFLGGFEYKTKNAIYTDSSSGDVTSFTGKEWITRNGDKVYELIYHGGVVKE